MQSTTIQVDENLVHIGEAMQQELVSRLTKLSQANMSTTDQVQYIDDSIRQTSIKIPTMQKTKQQNAKAVHGRHTGGNSREARQQTEAETTSTQREEEKHNMHI